MITPADIQNKEFAKGVRGYKEEEVDMFLDLVTLDLEKIVKENVKLKAQVTTLEAENEKYKGTEGEVVMVLQQAQELMGDISKSAEKRAEVLLKNAELDAELTVREARENAQRLKEEHSSLQKRYVLFRDKYKQMLEDELYRFQAMTDDLFPRDAEDRLEQLLEETEKNMDVSDKVTADVQKAEEEVPITDTEASMSDKKTMVIE